MSIWKEFTSPVANLASRLELLVPGREYHLSRPLPARFEVFQRVVDQHTSASNNDDLFADAVHITQQMRRKHHCHAVGFPQALHQAKNLLLAFGIQAIGWLVQENNLRV